MKITFFSVTPLAGMPWRTMQVCNSYLHESGGWARSIVCVNNYGPVTFPADMKWGEHDVAHVLHETDVVIVPAYIQDNFGGLHTLGKPIARHYSTEPWRWCEQWPDPQRSTVVAQYQARFAEHLDVLPNCMPIDLPMFQPSDKPEWPLVILYTPSGRERNGWSNKGYEETSDILDRLKKRYGQDVETVIMERRPYEEIMEARRKAHVVIDECMTGSYHSTALEGLACGCVSVCWIDAKTRQALVRLLSDEEGAYETLPFCITDIGGLGKRLASFVEDPDYARARGMESRDWMERYYSQEWQARKWVNWHHRFCERSRAGGNM